MTPHKVLTDPTGMTPIGDTNFLLGSSLLLGGQVVTDAELTALSSAVIAELQALSAMVWSLMMTPAGAFLSGILIGAFTAVALQSLDAINRSATTNTDAKTDPTPTTEPPKIPPAKGECGQQVTSNCEMVPVWFGQARISANFRDPDRTPITADPAGFRMRVFSDLRAPGIFITMNNRTLANYSLARASTAPACLALPTPIERRRLDDRPVPPQTGLPSPVIAVTERINDPTPVSPYKVTSTVSVSRTISPC